MTYAAMIDRYILGSGLQETEEILEGIGVCRIPEPLFVFSRGHQSFHSEFFEMMRKRRVWYIEFGLNIADDHPFRVRREQQPYNLEPRLGAQRCEHIGIPRSAFAIHSSRILEI